MRECAVFLKLGALISSPFRANQMSDSKNSSLDKPGEPKLWQPKAAGTDKDAKPKAPRPKEYGGRDGLDPTRYGDWEKNGRCIDF